MIFDHEETQRPASQDTTTTLKTEGRKERTPLAPSLRDWLHISVLRSINFCGIVETGGLNLWLNAQWLILNRQINFRNGKHRRINLWNIMHCLFSRTVLESALISRHTLTSSEKPTRIRVLRDITRDSRNDSSFTIYQLLRMDVTWHRYILCVLHVIFLSVGAWTKV